MSTLVEQRIVQARAQKNQTVICKMPSGWAVLGDWQHFPGYSLLLADPIAPDLNSLDRDQRAGFLLDMARLGDAILTVTGARRINYEILGNSDTALHAHVFPRYSWELEELANGPVYGYQDGVLHSLPFDLERDAKLIDDIRAQLV